MKSDFTMPLEKKMVIESEGCIVFDKFDSKTRKTFSYIQHPDGLIRKWFGTLADINRFTVEDGEYIELDTCAWDGKNCPPPPDANMALSGNWYSSINETWSISAYNEKGELIPAIPIWLMVTIVMVATSVTFLMAILFIRTINAPCGHVETTRINECWKMVTAPDCSVAEFNACAGPDNNGDGKPDGQWGGDDPNSPDWHKDIFDPKELIKWAVIGAIAIAGVIIVMKVIPKKHPYYPQQQYRAPPRQPRQPRPPPRQPQLQNNSNYSFSYS